MRRGDHDCCGGRGRWRRHILLLLLLDGGGGRDEGSDKVKVVAALKDKVTAHSLEEELVEVMAEDGGVVVEVRKVCQTAAQTQVLRERGKSRVFVCYPIICLLLTMMMMMMEVVLLRGGGVVVVLVVSLLLRDN